MDILHFVTGNMLASFVVGWFMGAVTVWGVTRNVSKPYPGKTFLRD
jgi:hypothetical protein